MSSSTASREPAFPKDVGAFVHWVDEMNADMYALGEELCERTEFALVHSHDWLVAAAAQRLARRHQPAVGDDGPRDGIRTAPGMGRQAPAVPYPRGRAHDGPERRPGDHVLALHARTRGDRVRDRAVEGDGDPQRDRPARPRAGRRRPGGAPRAYAAARRAPGAAGRPARVREGLPPRAGRARAGRQAARQRPLRGRRDGYRRGRAQAAGAPARPSALRLVRRLGRATTCSTRCTGSPSS